MVFRRILFIVETSSISESREGCQINDKRTNKHLEFGSWVYQCAKKFWQANSGSSQTVSHGEKKYYHS